MFIKIQGIFDMKPKIIIIATLFIFVVGCANKKSTSQEPICKVSDCTNICIKTMPSYGIYGDYCSIHTCLIDDCDMYKDATEKYCSWHTEQQIQLSETQVQEVKNVVDLYCKKLMTEHTYILAVNLFHEEPKISNQDIYYKCNVVRDDNDTNLATIYLYITDDGTVKIKELKYD